MELRHLRYFCAVAEQQCLTRAAELLPVAQPSLSRQMRDLEDELGARLFIRQSKGVQLTDAGLLFLQHARRILSQVTIASTAVSELAKGHGGEFIVGGDWRLPVDLVPMAVRELRRAFPKVHISLMELPMHEQMAALRERRIHIGFLPYEMLSPDDTLETRAIARSDIVVVMPATHALAGCDSVELQQVERETWITLDEKALPGGRQIYRRILKPFHVNPVIEQVAATMDGVIARVAMGEGVALLPRILVNRNLEGLHLATANGLVFQMCAVWPKDLSSPLLPALLSIIDGYLAGKQP